MNSKISESIRHSVIRLWLEGKSRKYIAVTCGVSEGTVSNIVSDWGQKLSEGDAEALRELGSNLKRTGIDAAQCAQGFRNTMIMRKMGINEEAFESFISKVYQRCQKGDGGGLTSDNICSCLEDLLEFSKEDDDNDGKGNAIKLSEIPHYIEQMKNEKRILKQDIQNLKQEKKVYQREASWSKELHDAALENGKTTDAELREYSNLKAELKKYDLDIHTDISKFAKVVNSIRHYGYDVNQILSEFEDLQSMKFQCEYYGNRVNQLVNQKMNLEQNCSILQHMASVHFQKLSSLDELRFMGFGLNELRLLSNTIKELASEKGTSYKDAFNQFFELLEKQYDIKLKYKVQNQQKYTKDYNPILNSPSCTDIEPSTRLSKPSALVDRQQQQQPPPPQRQTPSSSFTSYTYREITTTDPKTTKEQNNRLNNNNDDESDRSDDDLL
jgi:hypothetical protein